MARRICKNRIARKSKIVPLTVLTPPKVHCRGSCTLFLEDGRLEREKKSYHLILTKNWLHILTTCICFYQIVYFVIIWHLLYLCWLFRHTCANFYSLLFSFKFQVLTYVIHGSLLHFVKAMKYKTRSFKHPNSSS